MTEVHTLHAGISVLPRERRLRAAFYLLFPVTGLPHRVQPVYFEHLCIRYSCGALICLWQSCAGVECGSTRHGYMVGPGSFVLRLIVVARAVPATPLSCNLYRTAKQAAVTLFAQEGSVMLPARIQDGLPAASPDDGHRRANMHCLLFRHHFVPTACEALCSGGNAGPPSRPAKCRTPPP